MRSILVTLADAERRAVERNPDLETAETRELRAQLDYRTALVTFDRVQESPA